MDDNAPAPSKSALVPIVGYVGDHDSVVLFRPCSPPPPVQDDARDPD